MSVAEAANRTYWQLVEHIVTTDRIDVVAIARIAHEAGYDLRKLDEDVHAFRILNPTTNIGESR